MKKAVIAGATGYLGRYLCAEYSRRGYYVTALVRDVARAKGLRADNIVVAEATYPASLHGVMNGADIVVSALGITRQADGLGYEEVDYRANLNLLREAEAAGVERFAYIHVFHADQMQNVPLVAAKSDFVAALQASRVSETVIAPTGFFSDMAEILDMARSGRVWLFGNGARGFNPIHGADLAKATADATQAGRAWCDVGGPEVFSHRELAELAFEVLHKPARITFVPDGLRKLAFGVLPYVTPRRVHGPTLFFLAAMGRDMVAPCHGAHRLETCFRTLAET
ncbi:MAG: SDR family oxidoreductase [Rhodobacteraceae bacterium]|nr:SDR family oxidoreductase [Paracoccaceae bacterium]